MLCIKQTLLRRAAPSLKARVSFMLCIKQTLLQRTSSPQYSLNTLFEGDFKNFYKRPVTEILNDLYEIDKGNSPLVSLPAETLDKINFLKTHTGLPNPNNIVAENEKPKKQRQLCLVFECACEPASQPCVQDNWYAKLNQVFKLGILTPLEPPNNEQYKFIIEKSKELNKFI